MKKVGDKATEHIDSIGKTLSGVVIFVHSKRRFYTVEFSFPLGCFRESFTEIKYKAPGGGGK